MYCVERGGVYKRGYVLVSGGMWGVLGMRGLFESGVWGMVN